MAVQWITSKKYEGVRYRMHATRKIGGSPHPDRYYVIRYYVDGKRVDVGLGWASQEFTDPVTGKKEKLTEKRASEERARLKRNVHNGEGPVTLKAAREKATAERAQSMTFGHFWEHKYLPRQTEKRESSVKTEKSYYKNWLKPILERVPVNQVGSLHVERIKKSMRDGNRQARSIQYAIAIIRQAFNVAIRLGIVAANPCAGVEKPKVSNSRLRFLSAKEADELLATIRKHDADLADMTLLSLHAGLRAGEVVSLTWGDVDEKKGTLLIRETKNAEPRSAFMSAELKDMFKKRKRKVADAPVFPGWNVPRLSKRFGTLVKNHTKLNDSLGSKYMKVCFHTCRHTFASWQLAAGADLPTLQRLMGHKTIQMVLRYAKVSSKTLEAQTGRFEAFLAEERAEAKTADEAGEQKSAG